MKWLVLILVLIIGCTETTPPKEKEPVVITELTIENLVNKKWGWTEEQDTFYMVFNADKTYYCSSSPDHEWHDSGNYRIKEDTLQTMSTQGETIMLLNEDGSDERIQLWEGYVLGDSQLKYVYSDYPVTKDSVWVYRRKIEEPTYYRILN